MTTRVIPIRRPRPHFSFSVNLQGTPLQFRFDWLTRFEYYSVTISQNGETLLAGRGLHPNVDLLIGIQSINVGSVYLSGAQATPNNLGQDNQIVWEFEQ